VVKLGKNPIREIELEQNQVKKSFTIRDLPSSERPRERLQSMGAENLSVQELLAVILGRGIKGESILVTIQRLLDTFKDIQGISNASVEELFEVRGIGLAKACQIKAVFELANRRDMVAKNKSKIVIKTPEDAYQQIKGRFRGKKKEYFLAILLDTRNQIIKSVEISIGSLDTSIVHPREVFKEAIVASAASRALTQ
jgi:DNA repair protein RadC